MQKRKQLGNNLILKLAPLIDEWQAVTNIEISRL